MNIRRVLNKGGDLACFWFLPFPKLGYNKYILSKNHTLSAMKTLSIQNIYSHGYQQGDLDLLQGIGFSCRPGVSTFAGSQTLRFIDFSSCPCLECVEVTDHQAYLDFIPPGMVPYTPGISLGLVEESQKSIQDFQAELEGWGPYLLHENYEGSQEEYQPGWNYLNFTRSVIPDTFVWITEYEKPFPATHPKTNHLNNVTGITGLVFDLEEKDLAGLSSLTGEPFREGKLDLGGVKIFSREAAPVDDRLPEKEFPLSAVILEAKNLDFFHQLENPLTQCKVLDQPAVRIKTPPQSWDLIITS